MIDWYSWYGLQAKHSRCEKGKNESVPSTTSYFFIRKHLPFYMWRLFVGCKKNSYWRPVYEYFPLTAWFYSFICKYQFSPGNENGIAEMIMQVRLHFSEYQFTSENAIAIVEMILKVIIAYHYWNWKDKYCIKLQCWLKVVLRVHIYNKHECRVSNKLALAAFIFHNVHSHLACSAPIFGCSLTFVKKKLQIVCAFLVQKRFKKAAFVYCSKQFLESITRLMPFVYSTQIFNSESFLCCITTKVKSWRLGFYNHSCLLDLNEFKFKMPRSQYEQRQSQTVQTFYIWDFDQFGYQFFIAVDLTRPVVHTPIKWVFNLRFMSPSLPLF